MLTKWDYRFVHLARQIAEWSKDPKRKVGAIVVSPDRRQWTGGYNGPPAGIDLKHDQADKNELTIHAELNAIFNAAVDIAGWSIYVTRHPCLHCAMGIIQNGIVSVICPPPDPKSKWHDSHIKAADLLRYKKIYLDYCEEQ